MGNNTSGGPSGKLYYLKRRIREMPEVSAVSGCSLISLYLKFAFFYAFERTDFECYRALRLYDYARAKRKEFLLTHDTILFSDMLNADASPEEIALVDDKHLFDRTFHEFVRRDWLYLPEAAPEQVHAFLTNNEVFLAKACISNQGKRVVKHRAADVNPEALAAAYRAEPYILEGFVVQHPSMAALNPSTVNTIRIQTARKDNDVILLGGCLRCGGADAFVDNFHAGGVAYPLDMETGIVAAAGRKLTGEYVRRHPSTGRFMPGFQVPMWDRVLQAVRKAAVLVPHIGYVGWDIALTAEGPEFIEGNINYPDPIVVQLDGHGCYQQLKDFVGC